MTAYVEQQTLETITCYKCACLFAVPQGLYSRRRDDRQSFWCPNGHEQHFTGPSKAQKLEQELERERQRREAADARAATARAQRDQVTKAHRRMRVRVFNGVCPCCNRTFQNLLRHMHTEHPEEHSLKSMREAIGFTQSMLADEIGVSAPYVSSFERGRYVPSAARMAIEFWIEQQGPKEAA